MNEGKECHQMNGEAFPHRVEKDIPPPTPATPVRDGADFLRTIDAVHTDSSYAAIRDAILDGTTASSSRAAHSISPRSLADVPASPSTTTPSKPHAPPATPHSHQTPRRGNRPPPPPPPRIQQQNNDRTPLKGQSLEIEATLSHDSTSSSKKTLTPGARTPTTMATSTTTTTIYSPAHRLSQAHAEDVLAVSLDLERTKQSLDSEQTSHEETKWALEQAEAKNLELQEQVDKLLNDLETQRQSHGLTVENLERDLERAQNRAQSAEEDAQLALDLAKGNSESREQLEGWLQRALHEVDVLRDRIITMDRQRGAIDTTAAPPSANRSLQQRGILKTSSSTSSSPRIVRFQDDNDIAPPTTQDRPTRGLVAAGRNILHRSLSPSDTSSSVVKVVPPQLSTSRLKELRGRLASLSVPRPPSTPPPSLMGAHQSQAIVEKAQAVDVCRKTSRVLKESGKRLEFSGRWFNGNDDDDGESDDMHLEALARQYCTSVELSLEHKAKDILELESLIALWEKSSPSLDSLE